MRKRYLPIVLVFSAMLIVSVVGYMLPTWKTTPPARILFETKGGNVVFSHETHSEMPNDSCQGCHHGGEDLTSPIACAACHARIFDAAHAETHTRALQGKGVCTRCHHAAMDRTLYNHDDHLEYDDYCLSCHHGPDIEAEPRHCAECHAEKGDADMPGIKDAVHERCSDCHSDAFDAKLEGCSMCHDFKAAQEKQGPFEPCGQCHDVPTSDLVPARTDAFHALCQDCHQELDSGPFGDTGCAQCHIR